MNLNGNHLHIQPDKQEAMYFTNHPIYQNVYPQQCPVFLGHTKHTTILGTPHSQANLHNTQVIHNIHSNEHINQMNQAHDFEATTNNMQPVHTIQVSLHNAQPVPHNTHVIAYNIQTPLHNTQVSAHNTPVSAYNTQVDAHNTQAIGHNIQPALHNTEVTAHNTQPTLNTEDTAQSRLEIIQQNATPVEVQDTEKPKCLVKDDSKADFQKVPSNTVEHNDTETPKFHVKVEVKSVPEKVPSKLEKKQKTVGKSKNSVDTSHFTIEERLIAAVWVHERKNIKKSMRQLKHDFHQRFGRKAPAKNTLLGWERKLFSTGCLEDAPRTGRPVKRRNRVEEVAASIRSAPSLSLRARALALRVPTTTLHTILRRDLAVSSVPSAAHAPPGGADKSPTKKNMKKAKPTKRKPQPLGDQAPPEALRDQYPEATALPLC